MHVRTSVKRLTLPCAGLLAVLGGAPAAIAGDSPGAEEAQLLPTEAAPLGGTPTHLSVPDRSRRLAAKGLTAGSPVLIRIFKGESELELWLRREDRFELFSTYRICFWSGGLGPKLREGDRQAPEGVYTIGPEQLHLKGRQPRSLDLGFPNALDRANARTGSYILVHGGCRSIGCYAMTDRVMEEIFSLSEQALQHGQQRIQVHAFPFRLTEENLQLYASHPWHGFWLNLKDAYDAFERTHTPPRVGVCEKKYVVAASNAGAEAHAAIAVCERDEAEAALWQPPETMRISLQGARMRNSASRWQGRNVRRAYAAARRARMAANRRNNSE
jgi:murein L,D-transpeptidase YafK